MRHLAPLVVTLLLACGTHVAPPVHSPGPEREAGRVQSAAELAERGGQLFQARGCAACHTIGGGALVGPDLSALTERRDRDWIVAMISRPDSMLADDPVAREVGSEYRATMPRLGIEAADARALTAFLAAPTGVDVPSAGGCVCPGCRHQPGHGRARRSR